MRDPVDRARIPAGGVGVRAAFVGRCRPRADGLGRDVDRVAVRAFRHSGVQRLQRGDLAVIKTPFRHRKNVKIAAFRPPVTQDRGPGDIDAASDSGESRVERGQVIVERDPRLVRQDLCSGWHAPENTAPRQRASPTGTRGISGVRTGIAAGSLFAASLRAWQTWDPSRGRLSR
jgi:hypothetical protein